MEHIGALAGTAVFVVELIVSLVMMVGCSIGLYIVATKLAEKNPVYGLSVSMLGILCCPIGLAVPIIVFVKTAKLSAKRSQEKFAIMSALAQNPTDEKIDEFMALVDSEGGVITNEPQNWNAFRNLWFAVNGNPNVTTEKKNIFCMWLSNKGLILSAQQAKVIDNYKPNN